MASLTKVVATTAAAMLLVQRGKLDLEMPLGELLPGFDRRHAGRRAGAYVTLRHLLAHNSGLPGYVELFRTAATAAALYGHAFELPLEAEPERGPNTPIPDSFFWARRWKYYSASTLASWVRRRSFTRWG